MNSEIEILEWLETKKEILIKIVKIYSLIYDADWSFFEELKKTLFAAKNILCKIQEYNEEHFEFYIDLINSLFDEIIEIMTKEFIRKKPKFALIEKLKIYTIDYKLKQHLKYLEVIRYYGEENPTQYLQDEKAILFWEENFESRKTILVKEFIEALAKRNGEMNSLFISLLSYYLDFADNGYINICSLRMFLDTFGPFESFIQTIQEMQEKDIFIYHLSTSETTTLLNEKVT